MCSEPSSQVQVDSIASVQMTASSPSPPPSAQEVIEHRKSIIRHTWLLVEGNIDLEIIRIFYKELFARHPDVQIMFAETDMEFQCKKLYEVLRVTVRFLNDVDGLIPILKDLGVRHARSYGVVRAHYCAVTEVFVDIMNFFIESNLASRALQEHETALCQMEVASAWEWALSLIGNIMADGADEYENAELERQRCQELLQRMDRLAVDNEDGESATKAMS